MAASRTRRTLRTAGFILAMLILCGFIWSGISSWRDYKFRREQERQLDTLLPAYQRRFEHANVVNVDQAAEHAKAENRGSGSDETYFFEERRVAGPWFCSGETVAIEVVLDRDKGTVVSIHRGGRFLDCL